MAENPMLQANVAARPVTATITVDTKAVVEGLRDGFRTTLAQVRSETAAAIRQVAASETDPRVTARLHEVAALVARELSDAEAKLAVEHAPVHRVRPPLMAVPTVKP